MIKTRLSGPTASQISLLVCLGAASLTSGFIPTTSVSTHGETSFARVALSGDGRWGVNAMSSTTASSPTAARRRTADRSSRMTMLALPAAVSTAAATIKTALLTGPHVQGVAALTAVSALAVVPLTLIRQAYSFSVGYGTSVSAMSLALMASFGIASPLVRSTWVGAGGGLSALSAPALLAYGGLFYGVRLSSFLFLRELSVPRKSEQIKKLDRTSPPARIPFATAVAVFYAFMASPVLYALRAQAAGVAPSCALGICSSELLRKVQWAGVGLAYLGLGLETVADHHKFMVKRQYGYASSFVGPTGGVYSMCRHPNYLGEILFWAGIYLGGSVSFGKSVAAWAFGSLGLWGIVSIMTGATKRLDEKQADKYEGQLAYVAWREDVKAPLVPFVKG